MAYSEFCSPSLRQHLPAPFPNSSLMGPDSSSWKGRLPWGLSPSSTAFKGGLNSPSFSRPQAGGQSHSRTLPRSYQGPLHLRVLISWMPLPGPTQPWPGLWVGLIRPSSFLLEDRAGEPPLTWAPELFCLKPRVLSLGPKQEGH